MPRQRLSRSHLTATGAVLVAATAAVALTATAGAKEHVEGAVKGGRAKNVILLIGDGTGDSEITLARDCTVGAAGRLNMDRFPLTGTYTTYAVHADGTPDHVTDSAASGTGWATGVKTVNGRISKTPGTDMAVPTILELAQKGGYATGSVTTAELTDATPAVLASHATDRSCQGPADMAKCPTDTIAEGGPGSIAEQSVNHQVDVLLGGGKQRFDQKVSEGKYRGLTVTEQARKLGYQVVTDGGGHRPDRPVHHHPRGAPGALTARATGPWSRPARAACRRHRGPAHASVPVVGSSRAGRVVQGVEAAGLFVSGGVVARRSRRRNGVPLFAGVGEEPLRVGAGGIEDGAQPVCGQGPLDGAVGDGPQYERTDPQGALDLFQQGGEGPCRDVAAATGQGDEARLRKRAAQPGAGRALLQVVGEGRVQQAHRVRVRHGGCRDVQADHGDGVGSAASGVELLVPGSEFGRRHGLCGG